MVTSGIRNTFSSFFFIPVAHYHFIKQCLCVPTRVFLVLLQNEHTSLFFCNNTVLMASTACIQVYVNEQSSPKTV